MNEEIRAYFATIGSKGGKRSRRALTPEQAKEMVKIREARRAFKKFKTHCFWSFNPDLKITGRDIPWVAKQLMQNGNREAWLVGTKLCN